ncbi:MULTISPECIES: hypothetical protein [Brevibacillus]|uniref:hypothetical protein n=1 Tax=Brevibacillus TaxID=55080 RepID=UPI000D114119|nr:MULTISPECIES: hypothetical protein [Brevibacillus]PSJ69535.1 hypothetical protein C7J99_08985 [Brevibacillus brevis]RED23062.1 hypothetical protein DES34_11535 [Brevibacillus brevis]TQK45762.1 hypothetical protein FB479_113151 [Brevibacillus sp. AG162]VEF87444.1 Uncharacterised protein [Brevibacillus brevis]GEC89678.1 hypothetical protein BBR01nite_20090 [Brevibacillus brevis]
MSKRKALPFTLIAVLLLSSTPVLSNEAAAASSHKAKATVTASKLEELSIKDLNQKTKATLNHVKEVMPDLKNYHIASILKESVVTTSGPIDRLEILLSSTREGTSTHFGVIHVNASTGELIGVDIQNKLPSSKEVFSEQDAIKKGKEHLKRLFGKQAEKYKFSEIHSSTSQDNKKQILVIYTSTDHSINVTMDSVGELKAFKKNIYPEAALEGNNK